MTVLFIFKEAETALAEGDIVFCTIGHWQVDPFCHSPVREHVMDFMDG